MRGELAIRHERMVSEVAKILEQEAEGEVLVEGQNVGHIQMFLSEKPANSSRVAKADILKLDASGKPILVGEPETSTSPKSFGRSILMYTIVEWLRVKAMKIDESIVSPLKLLIVVPDAPDFRGRRRQLNILESRLKDSIHLDRSTLADFAICQLRDARDRVRELLA